MIPCRLSDHVQVKGRFHRSVHLSHDFISGQGKEEYLLSTTARELAQRILLAHNDSSAPRAWSITGPYGTGKSSFALFLTEILSNHCSKNSPAYQFRKKMGINSYPFICVPVVGRREPLKKMLLECLADATERVSLKPDLTNRIHNAATSPYTENKDVLSLFNEVTDAIEQEGQGGLLLILDEFGKFLEYASLHPDKEDLHLMQELAEAGARSRVPFFLLTILHTAFTNYLPRADHLRRAEWAKVQGRFQDVAFLEPPEQMLTLIGEALNHNFPKEIAAKYSHATKKILSSDTLRKVQQYIPVDDLLPSCVPLHPVTALLLWPIFRSELSQNERSLFSFLTSSEPFGFQDFLTRHSLDKRPQFYTIDNLYDYITSSLGPSLYRGVAARRWAEIDQALERISPDAPSYATAVVKAVGLLMLHGMTIGLRADEETLVISLCNSKEVRKAINYLESRSVLVFRRHQDAYGLWEGSDVDIEKLYKVGLSKVEGTELPKLIYYAMELRPFIARGHYFKTGTLRAFDVEIIQGSEEIIQEYKNENHLTRDGKIVFALNISSDEANHLIKKVKEISSDSNESKIPTIWALPRPIVGFENALLEVEAWKWILKNTPALEGDRAARMEVLSRLAFAQEQLGNLAGEIFGLRGYLFRPELSTWVYDGKEKNFSSSQEFLKWLSRLCDKVYYQAPPLRNELLNRDRLSSAAAAARNALLKAMLKHSESWRLGFQGTPAEVSMYEAMLSESGLHRKKNDKYDFCFPKKDWKPVWQALQTFLRETNHCRRPVMELYDQLKRPPFGLREGPLPVLLFVALLIQSDQIALYSKDGVFIPELRDEVVELLVRNPGDFEIQQYHFGKGEKELVADTAEVLAKSGMNVEKGSDLLLKVIKPLVLFAAKLPQFTKNTKKLSNASIKLRETLLRAKDPHELLFREVPNALGVNINIEKDQKEFSLKLRKSLDEMSRAYPNLLDEIEQQLRYVFGLNGTSEEAKKQLQDHAEAISPFAAEKTLSLFVREIVQIGKRDWREIIGRVVQKGVPTDRWNDKDAVEFQMRLQQLRSDFLRLEELVAEKGKLPSGSILRIGLLDGKLKETKEIISVSPEMEPEIDNLAKKMTDQLERLHCNKKHTKIIRIAALAKIVAKEIEKPPEKQRE